MTCKKAAAIMLGTSLILTSCSNASSSNEDGVGLAVVDNGGASIMINTPSYGYPELLDRIDTADTLSNVSYRSFDPSLIAETKTQPFEGYECLFSYPGVYIYKESGFVGVLDNEGNVVIPADTFARAEILSPTLIKMYLYDSDESSFVFADISDKAQPEILESFSFKSSNIKTVERRQEDSDRVLTYLEANGIPVGQTGYDSVLQKDTSELPADISCNKAYTVTKDGAYYIITFDPYYNYTIYEGTYARVDLNIAGKPGSCFILSYEDDLEVKTLLDSFKRSDDDGSDTKGDDHISFDFGLYGDDDYIVTLYSSGKLISQGVRNGSTFYTSAKIDTRCFGDTVRWLSAALEREYDITEEGT